MLEERYQKTMSNNNRYNIRLNRVIELSIIISVIFRIGSWMLSSLFWPVGTNMGDFAFRVVSVDEKWGWTFGTYRIIAEVFSLLSYTYRMPMLHILDDIMIAVLFAILAWYSKRVFNRKVFSLVGILYFSTELNKVHFGNLMDRDWYAGWLALVSILITLLSNKTYSHVISFVMLSFAIQIRPQAVLFYPCLILILFDLYNTNKSKSNSIIRFIFICSVKMILGVLISNIPIILMGGFWHYYSSMALFLTSGGYGAQKANLLSNLIEISIQLENFHYPLGLMLLLNINSLAMSIICRNKSFLKNSLLISYLHVSCIIWAIVNPDINEYHLFPLFLIHAIIVTYSIRLYSNLSNNSSTYTHSILLVSLLAFLPSRPYYAPFSSIKSSLNKILICDLTPVFTSFWPEERLPRIEWEMTDIQWNELNTFLSENIASSSVPVEVIQLKFTLKSDFLYLQFPLSNPPIYKYHSSFEALLISNNQFGNEYYRFHFLNYINSLKLADAGYIIWIPAESKIKSNQTNESIAVENVIRNNYKLVRSFGGIEIWDKL